MVKNIDETNDANNAEPQMSAPDIIHETVMTYYPGKTIRGRKVCLLRWHKDDTIDAILPAEKDGDKPQTIFSCNKSKIKKVSWLTTMWVFYIGDKKYKIGLSQAAAVRMGALSGFATTGFPGAAVAAGNVVGQRNNGRQLDRWWPKQFKQNGINYHISPLWIAMGVFLVVLIVVIILFVPDTSQ